MDAIRAFVQTLLPFEFLQFDFMVNALLAILLLTPLLGLLGTMAVNQQMAFFSDALGHSALTGIGLGILRAAPQCRRDLPPRALDRFFRIPPRRMNGGRVAVHLHIIRKHCLHHGLRNGGRRRIIQINTIHVCSFLFAFSFWEL